MTPTRIAYSLYAMRNGGGVYLDEIYKDPRGAANAAILEFDSQPETKSVIITRVAVASPAVPSGITEHRNGKEDQNVS